MPVSKFDLYLDESGSFEKGYSFVGGLLVPSGKETQGLVETLVTTNIHASERYSKDKYPRILQSLKENGGQFVIFQNPVNTIPLPGDFVYLNIMGEGIAKLMRALGQKHPDERIELNIIAAIRKAVSYQKSSGNNSIISKNQYFTRIDEKVFFAVRRASLANVTYEFSLEDARNDKRLMLADLICYTYRKKDDASFFKDDEKRSAICKLYEPEHIYTVLEDATTQYIENQLTERNYGEAMYRLCAMKQLNEHAKTRNRLVNAIVQSDPYEQEAWFNYLSLRIGQLNRAREFEAALRLANQYKTRFLARFREHAEMKERIDYWTFDTDFYLATIYDHVGNVDKCWKSLQACDDNINCIIRSWEHLDYYYRYRIRKLNALMNNYAFEKVLDDSRQLEKILSETTELFGMIETYEHQEMPLRSEMLGRLYGIQLMAYVNLLHDHPQFLDEALAVSEKALAQFDQAQDLSRQHQYRCLLHVEARQGEKALEHLLASQGVMMNDGCFGSLMGKAFEARRSGDGFLVWHYTNVMLLLQDAHDERAKEAAKELLNCPEFKWAYADDLLVGHPWNLALWNIARYLRKDGRTGEAKGYFRRAIALSQANKENTTMETLAISMQAEWLLWARENASTPAGQKELKAAEGDFAKLLKRVKRLPLTDEAREAFGIAELSQTDFARISNSALEKAARAYLR